MGAIVHEQDSGWRVVRVEVKRATETWVGVFQPVSVGLRVQARGHWTDHHRFGRQFQIETLRVVLPTSPDGIAAFLGSGLFPGIGPATGRKIAAHLGSDTFAVLTHRPDRLDGVPGLTTKQRDSLLAGWAIHEATAPVIAKLREFGVGHAVAMKVVKRFGTESPQIVSARPYELTRVEGVGFLTADKIAMAAKIRPDSPERASAGLVYVLRQAGLRGHCFLPRAELVRGAASLLGRDEEDIDEAVDRTARLTWIVREQGRGGEAVFLPRLYDAETRLAQRFHELLGAAPIGGDLSEQVEPAIAAFEKRTGVVLAPEQREAVATAARRKVLVITGGPGVGKTTIVLALLHLLERAGIHVALAAPTGRAAQRMTETTGREASTIHRLLEYRDGIFARDRLHPLTGRDGRTLRALIADETSMADVQLADALLQALPDGARLILVGDVDQLPSVGPGAVLHDVIGSAAIPTVRLTRIFRQAAASLIVQNAHAVNAGSPPVTSPDRCGDFHLVPAMTPEQAADEVFRWAVHEIPARFGLDPTKEVQVLVPQHDGEAGTIALNARLQAALNPPDGGPEVKRGDVIFRTGTKIMQIRNDYEKDVFNGDVGFVVAVDPGSKDARVVVRFGKREVRYSQMDLEKLVVAYACTVHRSQGAEYPAIVVVALPQHRMLLSRNLIYTALTRGRCVVVLVTNGQAMRLALEEKRREQRCTRLAGRLRGEV